MILTISAGKETDLTLAGIAAAAICGAGVTQPFPPEVPGGQPLPARPAPVGGGGIEVQCDAPNGPFAKAAFEAAGFTVRTPAGAPTRPVKNSPTTLNVSPVLPDAKYPNGASDTGRIAAIALCAACVTQPSPSSGNPFDGDPATSMQVTCDSSDIARATAGFGAVGFRAQT